MINIIYAILSDIAIKRPYSLYLCNNFDEYAEYIKEGGTTNIFTAFNNFGKAIIIDRLILISMTWIPFIIIPFIRCILDKTTFKTMIKSEVYLPDAKNNQIPIEDIKKKLD